MFPEDLEFSSIIQDSITIGQALDVPFIRLQIHFINNLYFPFINRCKQVSNLFWIYLYLFDFSTSIHSILSSKMVFFRFFSQFILYFLKFINNQQLHLFWTYEHSSRQFIYTNLGNWDHIPFQSIIYILQVDLLWQHRTMLFNWLCLCAWDWLLIRYTLKWMELYLLLKHRTKVSIWNYPYNSYLPRLIWKVLEVYSFHLLQHKTEELVHVHQIIYSLPLSW